MSHEYCVHQSVSPTPRPIPDTSRLPKFHYLPVDDTPTLKENGDKREVDDFHPRACPMALHKEKAIDINNTTRIQAFSNRYIVEENLVKDYIAHLNHLEMMSDKRKVEKQKTHKKTESHVKTLTGRKCLKMEHWRSSSHQTQNNYNCCNILWVFS